jgi:hypothetical protein
MMENRWAVLEHHTNGERSFVLWNSEIIRDGSALWTGLIWIDKSSNFHTVQLKPRLESSPLIVIDFPAQLRGLATGQTIPDVIFKIVEIQR